MDITPDYSGFVVPNEFIVGYWARLCRAVSKSTLRRGAKAGDLHEVNIVPIGMEEDVLRKGSGDSEPREDDKVKDDMVQ